MYDKSNVISHNKLLYAEMKCQLDSTEVFIADLITIQKRGPEW